MITLDALRESLAGPAVDPAYAAKQLHSVPDAPVVKREGFILDLVRNKRVLEFGASGPMHDAIVKVAATGLGVDRQEADGVVGFDLDDVTQTTLPAFPDGTQPDLIVCGEVLEHLSNPGWFLARLRRQFPGVPVVITTPNAHSLSGLAQVKRGVENCNRDHVAWYSYVTLRTLVTRAGYTLRELAWYNGEPRLAEGLIALVE